MSGEDAFTETDEQTAEALMKFFSSVFTDEDTQNIPRLDPVVAEIWKR